jgi:hypothetical protein
VEKLCAYCFAGCWCLDNVTFESGSNLLMIEPYAFVKCSSLLSICIPASVEKLCKKGFCDCESLAIVTFESGSKLSSIEEPPFWNCSSRLSISFPPSFQQTPTQDRPPLDTTVLDDPSPPPLNECQLPGESSVVTESPVLRESPPLGDLRPVTADAPRSLPEPSHQPVARQKPLAGKPSTPSNRRRRHTNPKRTEKS